MEIRRIEMMVWIQVIVLFSFSIYSLVLFQVEVSTSQEFVRNYFTDISGPVRFYAINTTLSVFLLWASSLIFAVNARCVQNYYQRKVELKFYLSQILIFGYLGFDDRFMVHEWLGVKFHLNDSLILFGIGLIELCLLVTWGRRYLIKPYLYYLGAAAFAFLLMIIVDGLVPGQIVGRLALEDLSKTWGCLFLFLFAWQICDHNIRDIKEALLE